MGVSTNTGGISPKMDGENFMENPINIDDLGGKNPYFWFNIHILKTTCPSSLNHHLALQAARTDPGNVPEGPEWRDFDRPPRLGDEFAVIVGWSYHHTYPFIKPFTWQFFVTFLGWLSDPFKGYVTSN